MTSEAIAIPLAVVSEEVGGDRRDQERNHFASDFNIESLEIRFINLASRWNGGNFNGIFNGTDLSGVEYDNLLKTSSRFSARVQRSR